MRRLEIEPLFPAHCAWSLCFEDTTATVNYPETASAKRLNDREVILRRRNPGENDRALNALRRPLIWLSSLLIVSAVKNTMARQLRVCEQVTGSNTLHE